MIKINETEWVNPRHIVMVSGPTPALGAPDQYIVRVYTTNNDCITATFASWGVAEAFLKRVVGTADAAA